MAKNENDENKPASQPPAEGAEQEPAPGKRRVWVRRKVKKKRGKGTSERKKTNLERALNRLPILLFIFLGLLFFPAGLGIGIWGIIECEDEAATRRSWTLIWLALLVLAVLASVYMANLPHAPPPSPPPEPVQ